MRVPLHLERVVLDPVVVTELFVVANLGFLSVDIYVAHSTNKFSHWAEWIPFGFSLIAPLVLVVAAVIAGGLRPPIPCDDLPLSVLQRTGRYLGMIIGGLAITVGVAGLLWHLESQFFEEQTLRNLVYAAPFVAPLAYSGIGFLILLNRMIPSTSDDWARWIILLALGGWIGNFALSLTDHAQNAFFNWAEWIPVIASAIGTGALIAAIVDYRNRAYLRLCLILMAIETVVGVAGWILHILAIASSPMASLWERIVYSAPVFAPLLFANLALLAMIGLCTLYARTTRISG